MGYRDDILAQPSALADTLANLSEPPGAFRAAGDDLRAGRLQRLVLTGMGSSLHAQYPLYYRLLEAGLPAVMVETSELIHHAPALLGAGSAVLAVSQSGRSAEIVALIERGPARLLAVTNTPGSPLAEAAHGVLLTRAGEEHTVSCKTYLTALAALEAAGAALLGQTAAARLEAIAGVLPWMEGYLAGWERHARAFERRLEGVGYVVYAGRGASLAAAHTAGLTTKESTRSPAEGMSSAAFRHGPLEMVSERVFVMVFEGEAPSDALNRRLVEEIAALGGRSVLVGPSAGEEALRLPDAPDAARPLLEMLPVQMLTLALAGLHGHTAGEFGRATKVTEVE